MREMACAMSDGARAGIWLVVAEDDEEEDEDMVRKSKKDALPLAPGRMPFG
jgi:hypothetical protein